MYLIYFDNFIYFFTELNSYFFPKTQCDLCEIDINIVW